MQFIGRYSYLWLSLIALGLVWWLVVKVPTNVLGLLVLLGAFALLSTAWILLYRGKSPPNPDKRLKKSVGGGRPVFVHFYSDYSLGSMLRKRRIDRLEARFKGRVQFLHINLGSRLARETAERYGSGLNQWILFDAAGRELQRGGRPPTAEQLAAALEPAGR